MGVSRIRWAVGMVVCMATVVLAGACADRLPVEQAEIPPESAASTPSASRSTPAPSASAAASVPAASTVRATTTLVAATVQPAPSAGSRPESATGTRTTSPQIESDAGRPESTGSEEPEPVRLLAVVGLDHDETLPVYQTPGEGSVVAAFPAMSEQAPVTANIEVVGEQTWYEVRLSTTTGWASSRHLGRLGSTDDTTWQIVESAGKLPAAQTLRELGEMVAETAAAGYRVSEVALAGAPAVADLGEVILDVIIGEAGPLRGMRLHVFAHPPRGGGGFTLKSVERTWICAPWSVTGSQETDQPC